MGRWDKGCVSIQNVRWGVDRTRGKSKVGTWMLCEGKFAICLANVLLRKLQVRLLKLENFIRIVLGAKLGHAAGSRWIVRAVDHQGLQAGLSSG